MDKRLKIKTSNCDVWITDTYIPTGISQPVIAVVVLHTQNAFLARRTQTVLAGHFFLSHAGISKEELNKSLINMLIINMKKFLDSDWSRAVQLFCNSVQKFVISCSYKLKANKPINDGGMNCSCTHGLSQANKPIKMQKFL